MIESHEDQLGHVAIDGQLVLAGGVEDVFDLVGQVVDVRESQHGRQSFEAVGRAEHLVEQFGSQGSPVVVVQRVDPLVQLQQPLIELREELIRLVEKVAQKAVEQVVLRVRLASRSLFCFRLFPWAVGTTMLGDARNPSADRRSLRRGPPPADPRAAISERTFSTTLFFDAGAK